MTRLGRIFRDYRESGAINSLIALWGFLDDARFVTKGGSVGVVFQMKGPDAESLPHEHRQRIAHQFEAGLRLLDEKTRVYQYLLKRHVDTFVAPGCSRAVAREAFQRRAEYLNGRREQLFQIDQYLVLLSDQTGIGQMDRSLRRFLRRPLTTIQEHLSLRHTFNLIESQLDEAVRNLDQVATAFAVQLTDCHLRRLPKSEAFQFFRRLVNFDGHLAQASRLQYDTHLDYFVADSRRNRRGGGSGDITHQPSAPCGTGGSGRALSKREI
jgi:type IV secretory pathway VirB4 component